MLCATLRCKLLPADLASEAFCDDFPGFMLSLIWPNYHTNMDCMAASDILTIMFLGETARENYTAARLHNGRKICLLAEISWSLRWLQARYLSPANRWPRARA